ncbi:HlyD family secretion protein [Rhodoblastus sp.]|uniref:HlyD family secretion protein n=1 Tax=Rhodoblastus sp. TaxID=1962975 RepID=UPI0035B4E0C6
MNEPVSRQQQVPSRREMRDADEVFDTDSDGVVFDGAKLARLWPRASLAKAEAALARSLREAIPAVERVIEAPAAEPDQASRRDRTKKALLAGAAFLAIVAAGSALAHYIAVGRFIYSTDDAYVRTDLAIVSPKISGYVEQVPVTDNQHVKAGQLLARIDSGDYQLAVDAARHKVQTQDATITRIKAQTEAQTAAVAQAQAQVDSARAETARAEADLGRVRALTASLFASKQRFDQSLADRDKANAALAGAQAQLAGAKASLVVLQSQIQEAERARAELAIAQARAERDLGFTDIKAPFDGTLGNRSVQPGQFVQPGARLMAIAPDNRYYIDANFKETQLDRLVPGQKARIRIDAYNGKEVGGVVESIAPASGSEFSLLPPENATGNFTKITQRFPVRIRVNGADSQPLRAGMSVIVDVDTRAGEGQ